MPTKFEAVCHAKDANLRTTAKGKKFLTFTLDNGLRCILWENAEEALEIIEAGPIECRGEIKPNVYNGYTNPQGVVEELVRAGTDEPVVPEEKTDVEPF